jgi:hypothetical protein
MVTPDRLRFASMAALRSPRLAAALLWLALALLPLRGLAAGLMPGMMAAAATVSATAPAEAPLPCHGHAAGDQAAAEHHALPSHHAAGVDDGASPDCPTCALCALCHGGFAHAAAPSLSLPSPEAVPPAIAPSQPVQPRAPDALFRPPRARAA